MEMVVLLVKPVVEKKECTKSINNPKKRRRNRKYLFSKRKTHVHRVIIPPKPQGDFKGFPSQEIDTDTFLGFTNMDRALSLAKKTLHPVAGDDLTFCHGDERVISISASAPQVNPIERRKLRVLSLFDGISTGYQILKHNLHLDIEVYFSSEIDKDALSVQAQWFSGQIIQLGSVKNVTEDLLSALGRIDLLIGGSPCSELSLVNWRRKGLHDPKSSSHLFYDFVRVRNCLLNASYSTKLPFFWMLENTSCMEKDSQECMSSCLGCGPVQSCSSSYLPAVRRRLFWGNIPNIKQKSVHKQNRTDLTLQDFLNPGRKANMLIAKTITSNVTNQKSGSKKCLPVHFEGRDEKFYVGEVEKLMGFPQHFTDVGNLSSSKRLKLLANAWCIPQVAHLLQPLTEMYKTQND